MTPAASRHLRTRCRAAVRAATLGLLLAAAGAARADCSRDIAVPVSASGASVVINGASVNGIYPDLLRNLGSRSGCNFLFSVVPRARQMVLYEAGKADLLIPAMRTPGRDKIGQFVPMIGHRAVLISLAGTQAPITSGRDLLERHDLRVAVVRGFDYGEQYAALVKELGRQGRLFTEVDANAVARLMHAGAVNVTIMGPTILSGAIRREPRVQGLLERLRLEPIAELPWGQSGAYISRLSLSVEDQQLLREQLEKVAKSGAVMDGFQRYHRADILAESVRPR
ncbi:substrate-binding periplasmic protein [Rugamonas sp. CCM 8940]|uniref:substrate-binding periplasmic protein n=1 Tax=Rugamonas sp. CCM 8940 TaxID=2765359 RepID=UPI0018F3C012|nr:transporter substrate-binding domain-containing protein [Rugamonas sp. CCM 8940]MBJ7311674.1 transporter substrate-binding domain-containing protein [Rugamonas sp. CCM 8940]